MDGVDLWRRRELQLWTRILTALGARAAHALKWQIVCINTGGVRHHGAHEALVLHHDAHLLRERQAASRTAYCTILADVQARFRRACGYDVKFLTGMDEHGEKVAEAAEKNGFDTPQAWCDSMEPAFRDLWETLEISNDDFIRTTQPRHIAGVRSF